MTALEHRRRRHDAARRRRRAVPRADRGIASTTARRHVATSSGADGDRLLAIVGGSARLACCWRHRLAHQRGLNLGIDFEGGVAWEVPAERPRPRTSTAVLEDNGFERRRAPRSRTRLRAAATCVKVQVADQPTEVRDAGAGRRSPRRQASTPTTSASTSVSSSGARRSPRRRSSRSSCSSRSSRCSSRWRFEWRMALAAIIAMLHDVVDQRRHLLGVRVRGHAGDGGRLPDDPRLLAVRHASSCSTRCSENEQRARRPGLPYGDIVNVSMNQVLMRSINTSIAAVLPVLSLLVVGAGHPRRSRRCRDSPSRCLSA